MTAATPSAPCHGASTRERQPGRLRGGYDERHPPGGIDGAAVGQPWLAALGREVAGGLDRAVPAPRTATLMRVRGARAVRAASSPGCRAEAATGPRARSEVPRRTPASTRRGTQVIGTSTGLSAGDGPRSPAPLSERGTGPRRQASDRGSSCGPPDMERPPTHPSELTYPCCLPALGELGEVTPRGGLAGSLGEARTATQTEGSAGDFTGHRTDRYSPRRRYRLVAYGARLESGLG